jgi:hypothetical protein
MYYNIPSYLTDLPIYRKALDIIVLSRSISTYLNHDLSNLTLEGTEDPHIYFSGDIIQQSELLAPEIVNAELNRSSDKKHKHIASVERLTNLLYYNCKRLMHCNSNGKDYLPILRSELKNFRQLQKTWILSL